MKKILAALLITVILLNISSCEKDDICVLGDTPLLIVGFYDAEADDTITLKSVTNLFIVETTSSSAFNGISSTDSIAFPIKIDTTTTQFAFVRNTTIDEDTQELTGTIDTLSFNYTVNSEYISRACGFIANFNDLDTTRQVFSTDWIKRISIINPDVERSNAIHVKIFH